MTPNTLQEPLARRFPLQPLHHLDSLWVQVAGTLCNLECAHCFVPSGPGIERHRLMSRDDVRARVAEAVAMGVKDVYLTGGEPFVHPEIEAIVEDTIAAAPTTVLTNGTLFTARRVEFLASLSRRSRYSLEIRVSLDGVEAAAHDAIRGPGSFARALDGLRALAGAGLLPIVTATHPPGDDTLAVRECYFEMLRAAGLPSPRLKLLPLFLLGREVERTRAYRDEETLAQLPADAFDPHRLQCGSCRAVTSRGVFVCPLLVDEPSARMGATLADAQGEFELSHGACSTCWRTGMTCGNG